MRAASPAWPRIGGCRAPSGRATKNRTFVVPDGEPTDALLTHISSLTQGERLLFEQGVLAGDTVLMLHEAAARSSRCRGCGGGSGAACERRLDWPSCSGRSTRADVVSHYEREARRVGVGVVIEDLVLLVVQLALAEEVAQDDALDGAEGLGNGAKNSLSRTIGMVPTFLCSSTARVHCWPGMPSALCTRETARCPGCGAAYGADDERAEIRRVRRAACVTPGRAGRVRRSPRSSVISTPVRRSPSSPRGRRRRPSSCTAGAGTTRPRSRVMEHQDRGQRRGLRHARCVAWLGSDHARTLRWQSWWNWPKELSRPPV